MYPDKSFISVKPFDSTLNQFIAYYYFHFSKNESITNFIYYPNYKNALTVYKNSRVTFKPDYSLSEPDISTSFSVLYSGVQTKPRLAEIRAPFDKIGIVFQPLGMNHFCEKPLYELQANLENPDKSFDYFGNNFTEICELVFREPDTLQKVKLLDQFFLGKHTEFHEKNLINCIELLLKTEGKQTVKSLAESLRISRRTLLRLFQKHLCCTPKAYIDIVQFRKTLEHQLLEDHSLSLTELAHENHYYDQPELIHHFQKLTGLSPGKFMKTIRHLGKEATFWKMD
ncbi:helix-turn-helix transcriptional regulator [Fluviicola taffensis]|uniref:helix-turn-helix transcriptional regulator n=1 Tax=Fluviicola taffensis TaxID=191579 RepID=UPI003137ABB0